MSVSHTIHNINTMLNSSLKYDTSHGSPFDRGRADSWYGRKEHPHKWDFKKNETLGTVNINLTKTEIKDYYAGYEDNEKFGGKKEW